MGHLDDAFYFVAPAYLVTFAAFAVLALVTFRRLSVWSRRAQDEDAAERGRAPEEDHQRTE